MARLHVRSSRKKKYRTVFTVPFLAAFYQMKPSESWRDFLVKSQGVVFGTICCTDCFRCSLFNVEYPGVSKVLSQPATVSCVMKNPWRLVGAEKRVVDDSLAPQVVETLELAMLCAYCM